MILHIEVVSLMFHILRLRSRNQKRRIPVFPQLHLLLSRRLVRHLLKQGLRTRPQHNTRRYKIGLTPRRAPVMMRIDRPIDQLVLLLPRIPARLDPLQLQRQTPAHNRLHH